jgi:hypothetical protein
MDNGRDMRCEAATRMVSDADGRPRDRGVRAHVRDCSPCRRFQVEIEERGRTFAAISPMPVIAAAGALKAALGGSGVAAVTGGAGAGAGVGGVAAGSIGASALLKPAVGLLAVLAIGTAAVDRGAIFEADRHDRATADPGRSTPTLAEHAGKSAPRGSHAIAWHAGRPSTAVTTGDRIESSSGPDPASPAAPGPADEEPGASMVVPRPRGGAESRRDDELVASTSTKSPALHGNGHDETLVPGPAAAPVIAPASEGKSGATPGGDIPPGQAKKETVPPGQAKKETLPPGQAKKQAEPSAGETSAPASTPIEASEHVPPGQAKKEGAQAPEPSEGSAVPVEAAEAPKVPPGQAKKEEAATE